MPPARIIFVPGLNPKPPPEVYRPQLMRVIEAALMRARPRAAEWLAAHEDAFVLVAWTYLFHGAHRDVTVDLPGIERLLRQAEPSPEDYRELASRRRKLMRWLHVVGDTWPLIGRWFAPANTRRLMHEANRYLKNRDGIGAEVRRVLRETLEAAWSDGAEVFLIGHSLGSVIAYDTLWELTHARRAGGQVSVLMTLGSPLATRFVQRSVQGGREEGLRRYPHNVRRWVNLTARGDATALRARLKPLYRGMLDLGVVDAIEDFTEFDNYFHGELGLNSHEAYGYLVQPTFAEILGDWIERSVP